MHQGVRGANSLAGCGSGEHVSHRVGFPICLLERLQQRSLVARLEPQAILRQILNSPILLNPCTYREDLWIAASGQRVAVANAEESTQTHTNGHRRTQTQISSSLGTQNPDKRKQTKFNANKRKLKELHAPYLHSFLRQPKI